MSLFIAFLSETGFTQDSDGVFHIGALPADGILLEKNWKYKTGDNPDWAKFDFNDIGWQNINPTVEITKLPQINEGAFVWFRLHLFIEDSSLLKTQPVLSIQQTGASEVFLNGVLIKRFGSLSFDPEKIRAYDPLGQPIIFPLGNRRDQVFAIRYQIQPGLSYAVGLGRINPVILIKVKNIEIAEEQYYREIIRLSTSSIFRVGAFLILSILHFAFFLFYRAQRANLYFFLYALFVIVSESVSYTTIHDVQYVFYSNNLFLDFLELGTFLLLTAIYDLLGQKKGWIYWTILGTTLLGIYFNTKSSPLGPLLFSNFVNFEIVRISIKAVLRKKRGAWIIAAGAICFLLFWGAFAFAATQNVFNFKISLTYTVGDLLYNLAFLSIPVATSIYLGLEFAFTNKSLM